MREFVKESDIVNGAKMVLCA